MEPAPLKPPFPPCCWYNLNHISVGTAGPRGQGGTTATRRNHKLRNVSHLTDFTAILGFSELHASEVRADACFFQHVPKLVVYYHTRDGQPGLAIGVNQLLLGRELSHEIVDEHAAHCVHWTDGDVQRVFLNFRLSCTTFPNTE